jgi:hypothetical protein
MKDSLQAFCIANDIQLIEYHETLPEDKSFEEDLVNIAKNDIKIKGFTGFRKINSTEIQILIKMLLKCRRDKSYKK